MAFGFPGLRDLNRQTVRAPVNPLDKATIVSIYPKKVVEYKVTLQPGLFEIPAGNFTNPSVLVIGPSSWWKDVDIDQPLLEIPVSAVRIAESVIKDYSNGILGVNGGDRMLGLFYIPGEFTATEIRKKYEAELIKAKERQDMWFQETVRITDILWSQSNGNPLSVSDDAKMAAHELGMKDKPWLKDAIIVSMKPCPACGTLTNPGFPVCPNCHTIVDKATYDKMGLTKAS